MPNLNEILTILTNRLQIDKKLDDLKQFATIDDIRKWKQLFRDDIENHLKQSKYESTDQFSEDVEKFLFKIFKIIRPLPFGAFLVN